LYQEITNLETKVKQEDSMNDNDDVMSSRVLLKGKEVETFSYTPNVLMTFYNATIRCPDILS
jgi:hypothetical protein